MLLFQGLDYETKVYSEVVRPLIDRKICPNFVRFLASGNGCNYSEMENMLTVGSEPTMRNKSAEERLARNLMFIRYQDKAPRNRRGTVKRPDINNNVKVSFGRAIEKSVQANMVGKWGYNILINEAVQAETFDEFEESHHRDPTVFWPVVFQVIAGCYAMALSRMTHNDIHTGNIWVEQRSSAAPLVYNIDGKVYILKTKYIAKIYDFDRSYVQRLGNNPLCGSKSAKESNQTNEFISTKDMIKFWTYFKVHSDYSQILRKIIVPNTKNAERAMYDIEGNSRNLDADSDRNFLGPKVKNASNFASFSRPGDIVQQLGDYLISKGYIASAERAPGGGGLRDERKHV